jgi:hypothetical protein
MRARLFCCWRCRPANQWIVFDAKAKVPVCNCGREMIEVKLPEGPSDLPIFERTAPETVDAG